MIWNSRHNNWKYTKQEFGILNNTTVYHARRLLGIFFQWYGPFEGPPKIATPTVFQVVVRDIGKSFQLAITTSRLNLIDYGNATAQSWLPHAQSLYHIRSVIVTLMGVKKHLN